MIEESNYEEVEHLEGLTHIRKRPGMYVGDFTQNEYDSAPMNLFREIIGNSIDEHLNGGCTEIFIVFHEDSNTIMVRDNGRGVPFGPHAKLPMSNLQAAFGVLNTGAKYNKGNDNAFKFSIGLNGVGAKSVNALSETFVISSTRKGKTVQVTFMKGIFQDEETYEKPELEMNTPPDGTTVSWQLDQSILPFQYTRDHLIKYLHESSYLNAGLKFFLSISNLSDPANDINTSFISERGIQDYLEVLTEGKETLAEFPICKATDPETDNNYEVALAVTNDSSEQFYPYVNGSKIGQSSTPVVALRKAFGQAILSYIKDHAILSSKDKKIELTTSDVRAGIIAVIKMNHVDPSFDAQTKTKLINKDIATTISTTLPDLILNYLLENQEVAQKLVTQSITQATARTAAANAKNRVLKRKTTNRADINVSLDIYTPPVKKDPTKNDLYLFEGISASNALIKAGKHVDPLTGQLYKNHVGILALKGVVLNTLEKTMQGALKNVELATLVEVSGLNPDSPNDLSSLEYNRFVIATDLDSGGAQIAILLINFFLAHFPEIIKQGRLCRVITPRYELLNLSTQEKTFCYDENQTKLVMDAGFISTDINKKFTLKCNKGLGEMSEEATLSLVHNPRFETLQYDNIPEMLSLFYIFSGKKFIPDRKNLIFTKGLSMEN